MPFLITLYAFPICSFLDKTVNLVITLFSPLSKVQTEINYWPGFSQTLIFSLKSNCLIELRRENETQ